jgi:hypothetical protein
MDDPSVLVTIPFWLCGMALVFFPTRVWQFYAWFHGPAFAASGNKPRHIRNAGILWLVVMTWFTYVEWVR